MSDPTDSSQVSDPADPRVMSGEIWDELCDTLLRARRFATGEGVPDAPLDRAEAFRYLTRFLAAGINVCVEHADPDHPEFTRMMDLNVRWGLDNPDCLYLYAPVGGDRVYRIHGHAGDAHHLDIQVNAGHYALGEIAAVRTLASRSGAALARDAEGRIDVTLGGEERDGDWLPLGAEAGFVLLRQLFYDWERERPADLLIERVGGPVAIPRPRTDEIAARIDRLRSWLDQGGQLWENLSRVMLSIPPNSVRIAPPDRSREHSGTEGQAYCMGNFRCAPDEAVILALRVPPCHYWGVSLASWWWEAIDFASHQSSLNGFQAHSDADGVVRLVIAHRDPAVPNWLDPAGHERGTLIARVIGAEEAPDPSFRVLPFAELADSLPPDTPRLGPGEREASLARRRAAVLRRYRR